MKEPIMNDSSSLSFLSTKKSKIIWAGPLLDAKCIIAIDSKFNPEAEWNTLYFTMSSTDGYEYNGGMEVRLIHSSWLECMIEQIKNMYLSSLVVDRKQYNESLH